MTKKMPIRATYYLVALFLVLVGIFYAFPRLDIAVSSLFFDPEKGFIYARHPVLLVFHYGVPWITKILTTLYILLLLLWVTIRWHPRVLTPLTVVFLMTALVLGPGFTVGTLKKEFGRPRPDVVKEFNGDKDFTMPLQVSRDCQGNCSFPSGHAAVGFYLLTFALVTRKYRKTVVAATITFGSLTALSRVIMGRHFLSDVVFSGYFVFLISFLLYYYVFRLHRREAK